MKVARISRYVAVLAALLPGACAGPTGPGVHAISGHVTLTGFLVDSAQGFAGTRVVGDADGVPVELLYGTQVIARTLTVKGVYHFTGIGPGGYLAHTSAGPLSVDTRTLTVTNHDLVAADTLSLVARGNLYPVPNPMLSDMQVVFPLNGNARVDIRVEDLSGGPVRTLLSNASLGPGTKVAPWDGNDASGHPAGAGMYWLIFHANGPADPLGLSNDRIALLFR